MPRFWAILTLTILVACLPVPAQNLVSPKLLPSPAELRVATTNASLGQNSNAASDQPAPQKHWTKGGKIMTFTGLGLLAGGGSAFAYGESNGNSYSCNSGGTCLAVDWKWTGVGWMAGGSALTVIGLTRHSTD
jgi:hypothetical protein